MLNWLARLLLTSTAIAPVLVTYAWMAYREGECVQALVLLGVCVVLVLVCLGMLAYSHKHLERTNFKASTVEAADRENTAFLLLYLLPLFTADFATLNWQLWGPAILIFGIVVATGYSYHFNPLLGLMGWHFYKVGTGEGVTYILITKRHLKNATEKIEVGQLTEYIVLDMGGQS